MIADVVVCVILAAIVGGVCVYLYRQKKRGVTCIGCPGGCKCSCNCGKKKK